MKTRVRPRNNAAGTAPMRQSAKWPFGQPQRASYLRTVSAELLIGLSP